MNTNVPAGTPGTTVTDVVAATNVVSVRTSPGETSYVRTDTPIARDQSVRFASKLVKAYVPEAGSRDPNSSDISILIEVGELWDKVVPDLNGFVFPAKAHLVVRVAHDIGVTEADVTGLISRLNGYVTANPGVIAGLLRQKTDVIA